MYFRILDSAMQEMSQSLTEIGNLEQSLQRIVTVASDTIPGADFASITMRCPDDKLETVASTSDVVVKADTLQYELHEGPCYDAVTASTITYSEDLSHDTQWPRFGPRAADLGLRSQMGIRLHEDAAGVIGLNLYSGTPRAFDETEGLPQLFASHAQVALGYAHQLDNLHRAIASREVIGTAIGITMERYDLTNERSFEFLIRMSQNSNTKLRDVAANIVKTRNLRALRKCAASQHDEATEV